VRRGTRLHANKARPQFGKELKNLRSTNTPADYHRAICIDAVKLKHRFRNIDSDRANLAHGRLPSMWLRFDATTLWHIDAAEWAPSTTSFASVSRCPGYVCSSPESGEIADIAARRIRART
jgi:hypothetical protein